MLKFSLSNQQLKKIRAGEVLRLAVPAQRDPIYGIFQAPIFGDISEDIVLNRQEDKVILTTLPSRAESGTASIFGDIVVRNKPVSASGAVIQLDAFTFLVYLKTAPESALLAADPKTQQWFGKYEVE